MAADEDKSELVTFQVKCAYVYLPLPSATSYGWRAELWDVERWYKEVKLKVVFVPDEDALYVRLFDQETGELFAECPLPSDGSPLTRAVEPVIDSSRYYALRVVDREDSKRHAFMGLGFRGRNESSSFSAALDDYRQYLRRKAEARQLQEEHEQETDDGSQQEDANGGGRHSGSSSADKSCGKFKLAEGQKLSLKLPTNSAKDRVQDTDRQSPMARRQVMRVFSLNESIAGLRILPPPPAGAAGTSPTSDWAVFTPETQPGNTLSMRASGELAAVSVPSPRSGGHTVPCSSQEQSLGPAARAVNNPVKVEDEEWGDFQRVGEGH